MTLTKANLNKYALMGLEAERARIDAVMAELKNGSLASWATEPPPTTPSKNPRKKMSAAARKRIGQATKKRWADLRKAKKVV